MIPVVGCLLDTPITFLHFDDGSDNNTSIKALAETPVCSKLSVNVKFNVKG